MGRKAASGRDAPVRRGPSPGLRAALFPVAFLLVPAGTALFRFSGEFFLQVREKGAAAPPRGGGSR